VLGGCAAGEPGTVSGGLGEDLRKPPTDASPSAEIEFTLSKKNGSAGDPHLPCPPRWGVGVCTGPASKKRIVRQLLRAATTCVRLRGNVQAIFCHRRHQPRRPAPEHDPRGILLSESILAELEEARLMAKDNGQPAAAVSASMGKAKLVGLVVDRKEVGAPGEFADLEDMTSDELREHFAALVRSLEAEAGFGDTAAIAAGAGKGPPRGKPH
jgi:hypothetical protein